MVDHRSEVATLSQDFRADPLGFLTCDLSGFRFNLCLLMVSGFVGIEGAEDMLEFPILQPGWKPSGNAGGWEKNGVSTVQPRQGPSREGVDGAFSPDHGLRCGKEYGQPVLFATLFLADFFTLIRELIGVGARSDDRFSTANGFIN